MRILCAFGEHQYGDPSRGLGTEYGAFIPALKNLGHEVFHFETWNRSRYSNLADLNSKLILAIQSIKPDALILVTINYEIWTEALDRIRSLNTMVISWSTDDSWKYRQVSKFMAPACTLITTTYDYRIKDYIADKNNNVLLTQWAAKSEWLQKPLPANRCKFTVSFIGEAHGDRKDRINKIREAGINVECFGHGWPNGPIDFDKIPSIMQQSFISLNFSNSNGQNQIKARTFEVPGAGGFLLTEYTSGIEKYYDINKEIATFKSDKELVEKINYYTNNPHVRDNIAIAGHERTKRCHTYESRLSEILDHAQKSISTHTLPPCIDFNRAIQSHNRMPLLIKSIGVLLTYCGTAIWGKDRGQRAARKLVFELSWRLVGAKTFSASGWPGRMFPKF